MHRSRLIVENGDHPLAQKPPRNLRAHRMRKVRTGKMKGHMMNEDESTPICRCRVLYLGSAVPHITKDGLQGIQEPLKELSPDIGLSSLKGIDSWLSVWSNGLLLENVDEKNTKISRFFPIESLHYCAAVRNVLVPNTEGNSKEKIQKFLPLDSPFAQLPNLNSPPLFASILRRTTGIKVLECHAFICKREVAANALVRCCFHAFIDSTYAKQLENGGTLNTNGGLLNGHVMVNGNGDGRIFKDTDKPIQRSVTPLDTIQKVNGWHAHSHNGDSEDIIIVSNSDEDYIDDQYNSATINRNKYEFCAELPDEDIYEGDENHKVWGGNNSTLGHNGTSELVYLEPDGTLKSVKSQTSRLSRPRQFVSPPPPPPPPPPQHFSLLRSGEEEASSSKKKLKKKIKKESKQIPPPQYLIRPASMMNLSTAQGHTLGRPGSALNGAHRPVSAMSTLNRGRPFHSQHLIPAVHPIYSYPPQPIYGPAPPPFAIPAYPTLIKGSKLKKQQKKLLTTVPILAPTPQMIPHPLPLPASSPNYSTAPRMQDPMGRGMPKHLSNLEIGQQRLATIERGYRYRSKQMNGGVRPSPSPQTAEGIKKEREIIQMVNSLDLSGDDIERSQVPPELYPPAYNKMANGHGHAAPRLNHR